MGRNVCVGWTASDDSKLRKAVLQHGTSWTKVSIEFPNRSQASLRNRYARIRASSPKRRYGVSSKARAPDSPRPVQRSTSFDYVLLDNLVNLNHNDLESIASDLDAAWMNGCFP